jgi:hypothetical protein
MAAIVRKDTAALVELGMSAFKQYWLENANETDIMDTEDSHGKPNIRNGQTAIEMLFNYIEERRGMLSSSQFELLAVEQAFAVPLDPDDSTLIYIGKIDKIFRYQRDLLLGEHKTTTSYKREGPFQNQFVESFSPNSQVDGYLYSASLVFGKVKAAWIDAALVHRDVHDGFRFIPVQRQQGQIETWLWEARYYIDQIEANFKALEDLRESGKNRGPYLAAFPKDTNSCTQYGGCPYIDLCKMWSNPDIQGTPMGFVEEPWVPFDELQIARRSNILGATRKIRPTDRLYDNTRIKDFRQCARMFYYRHVRNWKPEEDRLPLIFGGAWHAAMDVVWTELAARTSTMKDVTPPKKALAAPGRKK